VVAYLSALCNLRFTATQFALLSAMASIAGRFLTGTTSGSLIESMGYRELLPAHDRGGLPGIILFWVMMRTGLADVSIGDAGVEGEGDARRDEPAEGRSSGR
jgi:PAT family beta-lactamase induction signal transducer AmpG